MLKQYKALYPKKKKKKNRAKPLVDRGGQAVFLKAEVHKLKISGKEEVKEGRRPGKGNVNKRRKIGYLLKIIIVYSLV